MKIQVTSQCDNEADEIFSGTVTINEAETPDDEQQFIATTDCSKVIIRSKASGKFKVYDYNADITGRIDSAFVICALRFYEHLQR